MPRPQIKRPDELKRTPVNPTLLYVSDAQWEALIDGAEEGDRLPEGVPFVLFVPLPGGGGALQPYAMPAGGGSGVPVPIPVRVTPAAAGGGGTTVAPAPTAGTTVAGRCQMGTLWPSFQCQSVSCRNHCLPRVISLTGGPGGPKAIICACVRL